jgi:N-sulfoglucosamine sulfohydrolase
MGKEGVARMWPISVVRSAVLTLALSCVLLAAAPAAGAPRNVVLIIGDDHGLELGCYGHPVIKTPSLDRLAAHGTRFTNGFAAVSSCSPSRATIYTGTWNHANGQYGLAHADHNFGSFEAAQSLPAILARAGYRSAIIGKVHVKPQAVYPFEELPCPGGPRNVVRVAESVRQFLGGIGEHPFLLVVGFTDPHRAGQGFGNEPGKGGAKGAARPEAAAYEPGQMVVPPFLPDTPEARTELADYCRSVSRLDRGVGGVLDAVEGTGHGDDTLIIYLSDNGIPWPGAKTTLYEPGIHLPLIVSRPGAGRSAGVCNAMVSWVDVAPTILEWAGVKAPETMAGRSFLGILDQADPAGWDRVFASHTFHEVTMYYPMRMIRTRQYKYILNLAHELEYPLASDLWGSLTWQAVLRRKDERYGQRTVQALLHRPREELYDLAADPQETRNLAADPDRQALLGELRTQLKQWQERTRDPWRIKYVHE